MKNQAKRFKPKAVVKVYTEQGEFTARSFPIREGDAIDSEVLSISTNNDLASDAGVFTVTLVFRERWDRTIAANDLIIISMSRNPSDSDKKSTVFFGLVDSAEYLTTVEGSRVQRQVTISGRSFAKALINFEIGVVSNTGDVIGRSFGWLRKYNLTFVGQSAAQIIRQLFDTFIRKYANYTFSNKKTLMDYLQLDLSSREGEMLVAESSVVNYEGTMYNFFRNVLDEPFNQMFFEVIDGSPTFIVRETPFNPDKWKNLPLHVVTDKELVSLQLGRNDIETYTLYSVGMANQFGMLGMQGTLGVKPLYYPPYLKKYGVRRLHRYSNYIGTDSTDRIRKYEIDLFNWNVMNPLFYSGTLVVRGDNHYKVGDRLLLKTSEVDEKGKPITREIEFFIEGVAHEFINFQHWRTTLHVTRGLPNAGKGRFDKPWGDYKEYQGGGIGEPSPDEAQQMAQYEFQQMFWGGSWTGDAPSYGSGVSGGTQKVAQYYLNPPFRPQHNFGENRGTHIHKGEDLAAPEGTPIYALFDGTVIKNAYQAGGAGNYIVLQHPNGIVTKYFHMRERSKLPEKAKVKAGDLIGYVGQTGHATGAHLHLEIWINGQAKNPLPILEDLAKGGSGGSSSSSKSTDWWLGNGKVVHL